MQRSNVQFSLKLERALNYRAWAELGLRVSGLGLAKYGFKPVGILKFSSRACIMAKI